jgi:methionyl-tRNA formyltransferase
MSKNKSRIVLVGNRNLARHVLIHMLENGWNVVGAVSASGDVARMQAGFAPFNEITESHSIKLIETEDINSKESSDALAELEPDICICPAWHQIIQPPVLEIPTEGFVGFHSSDLPRGRGGAPINWSILHGKDEISISLFRYGSGVDSGDIITKESVAVEARDDVGTIIDKLAVAACDALNSVSQEFREGTIEATPQYHEEATYRPRRQPQDGIVDWDSKADELRDWVRAQTDPYPGAYTFFQHKKLTVWSVTVPKGSRVYDNEQPGTVTNIVPREGIDISVSDGFVRLSRVQPENNPAMWADEFAVRYNVQEGDVFGKNHAPPSWLYTGIRNESGGTDFTDATNLSVGEDAGIQAVISTRGNREVTVRAYLNERELISKRVHTNSEKSVPVRYAPEATGTHTLKIEFYEDGERIDARYLKVFVH